MPTLGDPVTGHHETVVTGIYIARGDDTLGPYNSLEAAALVAGGHLHADDYAARNGDTAWVALADFLPLSALRRATGPVAAPAFAVASGGTHPHRWRRLAAAFVILLAAPLVFASGMHWLGPRHADERPAALRLPPPVRVASVPAPASTPMADLSPAPMVDGPVHGSLSFALPGGGQTPVAGVRVSIYPLAALETSLAPINAEAQAARARFDPQIDAAATERATRAAETQAASRALREADPADPLIASLRFANTGARAAAKTADNDYRYLLDERTAAAGGGVYFLGLPAPTMTTDTDTRGHFTLPLPPGEEPFAVAACARQTADAGTAQMRYWLVKLSPAQRSGREGVRLDGDNVSSSTAVESLIHTAD